ncbi:protein tiptop [Lepeophtheirus salmonis]|uniref:protein tiptop n=1 Tax=Lepeophtheirus salmonis TaxID=72036 RepID=UPI001AE86CF0|nr:protein tiptop-like [Lepeophtheirus salmonis]
MGRRKQFCPQKTGILEAFENTTKSKTEDDEESEADSNPHNKIKEEDEEEDEQSLFESPTISALHKRTLEGDEGEEKDQKDPSPNGLLSPFGVSQPHDFASTLLAAQQTLLNPAAFLSLNPSSLYAVQLAQLQAAQLLSQQPPLKRKLLEQEDSTSPLDLSGPSSKLGGVEQLHHHHVLSSHHALQDAMQIHAAAGLPSPPKRPSFESSSPLDKMNDMTKGKQRHSAWQSQWINRGEENAKDIFKCTWCKECFHSFQALTHHMKETKHFGGSLPPSSSPGPYKNTSSSPSLSSGPSSITALPQISPPKSNPPPNTHPSASSPLLDTNSSYEMSCSSGPKKRDILKEQLPIPRKLVRGQDVWLGKGEEQTRNILKCMWCGESFRSLEVMTKHMQETKHYTKVISQDQISSWKSNNQVSNGSSSSSVPPAVTSPSKDNKDQPMNSILSCKVCETSFQTLKDLSDHMIKNNHCINSPKSPLKNSSPPASVTSVSNNNNNFTFPPKEKRKKSLPVKKLLELERSYEKGTTMKFPCDKCGISFPFHLFAEHIRNCNGLVSRASSSPEQKRSESLSPPTTAPVLTNRMSSTRKSHDGGDSNILGSLEEMVSGNFKGLPRDDVVIPVIKEGQDEDIAVDEEEQVVLPHIKSSPSSVKSKENSHSNKNPLEALQMLCDKNEKQTQNFYGGGGGTPTGGNPHMLGSSSPTDSMVFPWSPSPEALFKCPFCETPFVSKGAYRNHLSKMHFVKDPSVMMMMDPASIMALAAGIPSGFFPPHHSGGGSGNVLGGLSGMQGPPVSTSPDFEENSTSKFEKYSQLAKQLSNQRKPLSSPA